jgi:hypothetical protein
MPELKKLEDFLAQKSKKFISTFAFSHTKPLFLKNILKSIFTL